MKKQDQEFQTSRRQFLRQSACAALGYTGLVNTISQLTLVNAAVAQSAPSGYKALVVLFLYGGNDSNNMLIPRMGHPAYADYKAGRGPLKIMDPGDPARVAGDPVSIPITTVDGAFGVHPSLQKVADLFHGGDLAFVANVGTLAYPILTQQERINGSVPTPPQLFSHSNQQQQWQSSVADAPIGTGWGGRVADLLHATASGGPEAVSLSLSIAGINRFQKGNQVVQYEVGPGGAIGLGGYGAKYVNALNTDGTYKTSTQGKRLKMFEDIMRYSHENLFEEGYNEVVRRARAAEFTIGDAILAAGATGVNFDSIFGTSSTGLKAQLKMVAKLIAGRTELGNTRQIFFCSVSGYDTHASQMGTHANLMNELGDALEAFRDGLVALGMHDNVLTISHSDFTRTLSPNSADPGTAGSDHGWGGHQLVMGGGVNGGRIYGYFPNLSLNAGGRDFDANHGRGRWIPTTSVDQYSAVAAKWLGVEGGLLPTIFPNLGRFEDPFGSAANLGYV